MRTEFYSGILFFAIAVASGLYVGGSSLNGYVWFASGDMTSNNRNPAAIKREIDFSRLDGAELITATQKRLITAARVEIHQDEVGVVLGHFATRGEDGERRLACDSLYNRLTLHFQAEGISDAGEKPEMTIDAPCRTSIQDLGSIDAVIIPYDKILKENPTNQELSYEEGVQFKFESMTTEWPIHWSLDSVRLYNSEDAEHEVKISHREIREMRTYPLMIHWQDASRVPAEYRRY